MTVEWLGADDAEELPGPPRPPRRRRLWLLVAASVAAAVIAVAVLSQSGTGTKSAASSSPPVRSTPPSVQLTSVAPASLPATPDTQPTLTQLGRALVPGTSGWELFARSDDSVVRIQLATGRVWQTPLPDLLSEGGVAFVAGPSSAIVRPNDALPGYLVPDGRATQPLTGLFVDATNVLAGPRPDQVWVQEESTESGTPAPELYDLRTNRLVATHLSVPAQLGGPLAADGSGYLLYTGLGGVYDVRDTGVRRITTGTVVAVGTTKWITVDCDDQFRCSTVLVDQATLRRTTIGHAPPQPDYLPGTISPDGKYAAYVGNTGTSTESLHVIDLANFTDTELRVRPANVSFDTQPFVWAPSGHALFVSDNNETLELVDPATGSAHVVDPRLPRVVQLAVRVLS